MEYLPFSAWLISQSIMLSNIVSNGKIYFFLVDK